MSNIKIKYLMQNLFKKTKKNQHEVEQNNVNQENQYITDEKKTSDKQFFTTLKNITPIFALFSSGFGAAIILINFGVYPPNFLNVVKISDYDSVYIELNNTKQELISMSEAFTSLEGKYDSVELKLRNTENNYEKIRAGIIDSMSINTLILDTNIGNKRVQILKKLLDNIPFFKPTTAAAKGDLTKEEKNKDLYIAHWHAYNNSEHNYFESELVLIKTIEGIHNPNSQPQFLIYSSALENPAAEKRLKDQISSSVKKDAITWIYFSENSDSTEIMLVLKKILKIGLKLIPQ